MKGNGYCRDSSDTSAAEAAIVLLTARASGHILNMICASVTVAIVNQPLTCVG